MLISDTQCKYLHTYTNIPPQHQYERRQRAHKEIIKELEISFAELNFRENTYSRNIDIMIRNKYMIDFIVL